MRDRNTENVYADGWLAFGNRFDAPLYLIFEPDAVGDHVPVNDDAHVHLTEHITEFPTVYFHADPFLEAYIGNVSMYHHGKKLWSYGDDPTPAPEMHRVVESTCPSPPKRHSGLFGKRNDRVDKDQTGIGIEPALGPNEPIIHPRAAGWMLLVNADRKPLTLTVQPHGFTCAMPIGAEFYVHLSEYEEEIPVLTYGPGGIVLNAAEAVVIYDGEEIHNRASHPVRPLAAPAREFIDREAREKAEPESMPRWWERRFWKAEN